MSQRRLQKNIELWSKSDPKSAVNLQFLDTDSYTFAETEKGERNLKKEGIFFHDPKGAMDEAVSWFESLDLSPFDLIYIYGAGLGYAYLAAREWLKQSKKRHLVFLEDDLGVIQKLFETDLGSKMLRDKQVQILFSAPDAHFHDPLKVIFWSFLGTPFTVQALPTTLQREGKRFDEICHHLVYDANINNAILDEYYKYGIAFYRNYYHNLLHLPGSYLAAKMYGRFAGVPAIICGAGPSLEKQLPELKNLRGRALVFAGGSALNALDAAGIVPDFGAGIDPNPEQYERYKTLSLAMPFFFRTRLHYLAFNQITGPRLLLTGSGGYSVTHYFDEKLGVESEDLLEGFNVINLLVSLAYKLGCSPIITVGMDLGYTGSKAYAPGVVEDRTILGGERPIEKVDIYGKPLHTLWKWIAESEWIEAFAKEYQDARILNATEGGLGFGSVPNTTLKEALAPLKPAQVDVEKEVEACAFDFSKEKIQEAIQELRKSLKQCIALLDVLITETKLARKSGSESGASALAETELAAEVGFTAVLSDFNDMYNRILHAKLAGMRHIKKESTLFKRKMTIQEKKYRFLKNAARANIMCIDWALKNHASSVFLTRA